MQKSVISKIGLFYGISMMSFLTACEPLDRTTQRDLILTRISIPLDKSKKLSEIASKIEYLKLPDGTKAMQVDKALEHNSLYFFGDYEICICVSVVDSAMNLVSNIRNFGEGPGEFISFQDFTINQDENTVDILTLKKMVRFDVHGNFIEEISLPGFFYKLQHIREKQYLIYKPTGAHSDFPGPDNHSMLWIWDIGTDQVSSVPNSFESVELPFFTERNNLNFHNGNLLFSANFMDTVYRYDEVGRLIEKRFFSSDREYLPRKIANRWRGRLPDDLSQLYYYHQANLLEDENYFVTRIIDKGLFTELVYSKDKEETVIFSRLENDLDFGFGWLSPVLLKDGILISVTEPSWLISHWEKNQVPEQSPFHSFAKDLTGNSPLVLTKYHLK